MNLVKKILTYIAQIKDKNSNNLNEISKYTLKNLFKNKIDDSEIEKKIDKTFFLIQDLKGTSLVEALNIVESIMSIINLEGDICEFGVAQGKTSKLMAYLIKDTKKRLYLFDSFKGLPKPSKEDVLKDDIFKLGSMKSYEGKMSHNKLKVISELQSIKFNLDRVEINEGFFNQNNINTFKIPDIISFAYIDFDFYQPTYDVLITIQKRLISGSILIVDDYDFFSTGAKTAVDEWHKINNQFFDLKIVKTLNSSFAIIKKK
jgi:O-methyltransferase